MTVVVLTRDEESRLPAALASLPRGMKLLVVDAESSDNTREIAEAAGARVITRPWTNFVEARAFALGEVTTPWALALDADERLDANLRDAIVGCDGTLSGYEITRDTTFCGRPMRMWRGEHLLRLMRVDHARVEAHSAAGGDAALHERYVVDGLVGLFPGRIEHDSYPTVASYREKFAHYTDIEATGSPARTNLAEVLARFAHAALFRGALLDGPAGLYIAWMSALYPYVASRKARKR